MFTNKLYLYHTTIPEKKNLALARLFKVHVLHRDISIR